jgi:hypothetical protein
LGIDTSEQSFPYIAGYAASKDTKELKNILYGTQKTASALIKRFDEAFEEMYERKRIQEQEKTADIEDMLDVKDHSLNYCIVTLDDTEEFVTGAYIDEEEIHDLKEFQRYALKTGADEIDVEYSMYNIGNGESVNANDKEIEIIRNNLDSVLEKSDVMETDSFTVEPLTDEYEVYDETPQTESEKAAESTTKTEDFSDIIGVNKIESEHDDYHDAYCWTYFNPEGFDGKGQFVQMWFDEDLMRAALCDRRQITGQKGAELGNKAFVDCIYNNARTNLCDNDGDKAFGEWLEDFRNGECGHVIKGVDETSKEFYDKIVDVFASDSPAVSEAFRKERLNGYQPIKTDVAVAMWENGFSVVDNDGFEIAPFSESGYGMFTNVKDYVFYGDSNDYYRQQLFDEIAENVDSISENSEFDLSNCYEDYEWYSYNECQNAFLNVQELLRTGETEPLENYLKDVSRHYSSENLQDDEVVQNISGAIQAVKELKQDVERTRSLEREKSESQEATPIMSNAGGRGR